MAKKILIVDDEESLAKGLKMGLSALGYDAAIANNSAEAFKQVEEFKPDIILVDYNLNEQLTGIDVLKRVKTMKPDVWVIMATGFGSEPTLEASCRAAGADRFLHKPLSLGDIKKAVEGL